MAESNLYRIRPKFDYILFIAVMILIVVGILMVYSSSYPIGIKEMGSGTYFFTRHLIFVFVGFIAMIISMRLPTSFFRRYSGLFWILTIILCLVPFAGEPYKNTYRWIRYGGFSLQPSDFLKVTSALFFPTILNNSKRTSFETFIVGTLYIGLNVGIVYLQRDLSTAVVIAAVLFTMFFTTVLKSSQSLLYILGAPAALFFVANRGFRSERLEAFRNPFAVKLNEAWQVIQSMYAVANGGLWGVGIGNSIQKYFYLYASYSDYAFAIVCEELGFVRAGLILLIYVYVSLRFIMHSTRMIDTFSSVFLIAVGTYIGLQSLLHMGVVANAVPSTGITLPFISYGGTSILSYMILVGIGFNILLHSPRKERVRTKWFIF